MPPKAAGKAAPKASGAKTTGASKTGAAAKGSAKPAAASKAPAAASKDQPKKEEPKPKKEILVPEEIGLKEMANVMNYAGDIGLKLKASGRWLYFIDRNGNAGTFLKYRDVNMIPATSQPQFQTEPLRKALMGSLKFGKPHVLDISDTDQEKIFDVAAEKYNEMYAGCWDDLLSKKILEEERYEKLYQANDDKDYANPLDYRISDFTFIVFSNLDPPSTCMEHFFPVIIN